MQDRFSAGEAWSGHTSHTALPANVYDDVEQNNYYNF